MESQSLGLRELRSELAGVDFMRVVTVAAMRSDVAALAYALGRVDASSMPEPNGSCGAVVEAALRELGVFRGE